MNLYAVVRTGVYRHEIAGIFGAVSYATEEAIRACKAESDDYHTFEILEFSMNQSVEDGILIKTIAKHIPHAYSIDKVEWLHVIYPDKSFEVVE